MTDQLPPLGLWIDCAPRRVLEPAYWDQLHQLGVTTAAIMVSEGVPRWAPRWTDTELEAACQLAIERDLEVVLTTWPTPRLGQIDRMCDEMNALLCCGAVGWEIDVEGLWKKSRVFGFKSLQEAEAYLLRLMGRIAVRHDVRLELTSHTGHREGGPHARMAGMVDRYAPQCYSVRHRPGGTTVRWGDKLAPGHMQRWALKRCEQIVDVPPLVVGLAAWDQRWPHHAEDDAMDVALQAALEFDPWEVRYWSSKWVLRNAVVAGFLAQRWGR